MEMSYVNVIMFSSVIPSPDDYKKDKKKKEPIDDDELEINADDKSNEDFIWKNILNG